MTKKRRNAIGAYVMRAFSTRSTAGLPVARLNVTDRALMYDTVNRQLSFVGGAYRIDVDMDGKYSAGIGY